MTRASAPSTASSARVYKVCFRNRLNLARFLHSFRIVNGDVRAFAQHVGHKIDRDRRTDVVGVGFECQSPDRDFFVAQDPERFADRLSGTDSSARH